MVNILRVPCVRLAPARFGREWHLKGPGEDLVLEGKENAQGEIVGYEHRDSEVGLRRKWNYWTSAWITTKSKTV